MSNLVRLGIADQFCGAGGASTGIRQVAEALGYAPDLTAINHWPRAIASHQANHPTVRHLCEDLDSLNPRKAFPREALHLLWSSPECLEHSVARADAPVSELDQSRSTAHCVTRWADALQPNIILVENVRQFLDWGPVDEKRKKLKSRKGESFKRWVGLLESFGYNVEWRIMTCADYGDPTTRERFFLMATRGKLRPTWPTQTHYQRPAAGQRPWVSARSVIDWSLRGQSIFSRKKPLCANQLRRIAAGLWKFGFRDLIGAPENAWKDLQPFIVGMLNTSDPGRVWDINEPLRTVTTNADFALVRPFIMSNHSGGAPRSVENPTPTLTANGAIQLVRPFITAARGTAPHQLDSTAYSVDTPLTTLTAGGAHHALLQPFLTKYYGTGLAVSMDEPLDTLTCRDRFGVVLPTLRVGEACYHLDIEYRLLQPHEAMRAQGFPENYILTGTREEQIAQIGNSVPCHTARALTAAALTQNPNVEWLWTNEQATQFRKIC